MLAILAAFAAMIVGGGIAGILSLDAANASAERVHTISTHRILLNDAYKDMTRARSALTRAYSTARENPSAGVNTGAIDSATSSFKRSVAQMRAFADSPHFAGQDEVLQQTLVQSARDHARTVQRALDALRANNPEAYAAINAKDVTNSGAAYSAAVEQFQRRANELAQQESDAEHDRYALIVKLVAAGVSCALGLIIGVHSALQRNVIRPLSEAASLLGRVADGDLTIGATTVAGKNEVGRLLAAIARMQAGLTCTVRQVRISSDAVNLGAHEIAAGNLDLSSRTDQQSAALEATAASMGELTSTVTYNSENAREAESLTSNAADLAIRSGEVVHSLVCDDERHQHQFLEDGGYRRGDRRDRVPDQHPCAERRGRSRACRRARARVRRRGK